MAAEKPFHPSRGIQRTALGAFQLVVVGVLLLLDLRGQRVEAHPGAFTLREQVFRQGARQPSVPVVEGMKRQKPQMRDGGLDKPGRHVIPAIDEIEELAHLGAKASRLRRDEVDALHHPVARHDAQAADGDLHQPRIACRE